jgi:hypothetical protein
MNIKTFQMLLVGSWLVLAGARTNAQDYKWARDMFEKQEHDFGVVARGSDARYRLKITNKYVEPVHISNVATSCGCTAAKPSQDRLASRESAYIELTMDTRKFQHQKDSSVTVTFDQPYYAEVRIPVRAYIRSDVVLTPGGAQFGAITPGADAERKIGVAYAGRGSWKIKDVISKNPNIAAKVAETRRDGQYVNYDLVVTVKGSAPLGELRDQVTLVSDDAGNPYIPVLVEGRVEAEYSVSPELVSFGNVAPGAKKTMTVFVRGKRPFSIEKIESEHSQGMFEYRPPKDTRQMQAVPLTFIAPDEEQTVNEEFTVTIAGRSEPIMFKAYAKVVSTAATAGGTKTGGAATANNNP